MINEQFTTFDEALQALFCTHHVSLVVRPMKYLRDRIGSLRTLADYVSDSRVSVRGWDMPHYDERALVKSPDNISSAFANERYLEAWRVHKSCQFEFLKKCSEDVCTYQQKLRDHWGRTSDAKFYLDWIHTIYSFSEYFEFARRFAARTALGEGFVVEIQYRNMQGVGLSTTEFNRNTGSFSTSIESVITIKRCFDFDSLSPSSNNAAADAVLEFFRYFRWNVRADIVKQIQREFFELRIGSERNVPVLEPAVK